MLDVRIASIDSPIEASMAEALVVALAHFAARPETLVLRAQRSIDRFRADFTIEVAGLLLVIECDGAAFHDAKRDAERDERLASLGWRTLRFTGSAIFASASACADEVVREIYASLSRRRAAEEAA